MNLVPWACNMETQVCQMADPHVLWAIGTLVAALITIAIGYVIDLIIADMKKDKR